ncbi:acetylxylan esterase [uncultured Microscilla sp.]|uniref:acetylxylan esterase n=1 Tax=uncultured Microscilla sp. TaxID=432653 RepID=UPI00260C8244|nr:acetylxylan esterase [uncultured Microscilla sp.]
MKHLLIVWWVSMAIFGATQPGYCQKNKKKKKKKSLTAKVIVLKGNGTFKLGKPLKFSCQIKNNTYAPIRAVVYCNIAVLQPRRHLKTKTRHVLVPARKTIEVNFQYFASSPNFYLASCSLKNYTGWLSHAYMVLGYAINKQHSPLSKQVDFKKFWKTSLWRLRQVHPHFKVTKRKQLCTSQYNVYLVEMKSMGHVTVRGWYRVPTKGTKHPVILQLPSLGGSFFNVQSLKKRPLHGIPLDFAVLSLNIRGHGNSKDEINPQGNYFKFFTHLLKDPYKYVYRGALMDCIRAIDFLATRPELDHSRVAVEGASQGGALSLMTAALDKRVKLCAPDVPFLSDIPRLLKIVSNFRDEVKRYIKATPGMTWKKSRKNFSYFDTKNFAPYIKVPVLMSVGLQDLTCPPITCFATYNHIKAPKSYYVYPYGRHGGGGEVHRRRKFYWIRRQFGMLR